MKCAECGLPLSPSRTHCPRCGAPAGAGKTSGKIRLTRETVPTPPHINLPAGVDTLDGTPPVWPSLTPPMLPPSEPDTEQEPFPEAGGFFSPTATSASARRNTDALAQNHEHEPNAAPAPVPYVSNIPSAPEFYHTPTSRPTPAFTQDRGSVPQQPKTKLGFTISAICFTTGIIIMIFVFIMAQSLGPNNLQSSTSAASKPQNTNVQTQTPVSSTPTSLPTTPTATATLTSSQYITNVNLASSVDTATGQPQQTTTVFHASQAIYVTMTIQQAAYNGFVCLDWSVNNQPYPYASSATPGSATYLTQSNAYFYYSPGVVGNGNVKVSWASTTACTDKVLVQSLDFTVIA